MLGRRQGIELRSSPRIHAKVYVSGDTLALFGSANFTDGGAYRNFEYMAALYERGLIRQIREDVSDTPILVGGSESRGS